MREIKYTSRFKRDYKKRAHEKGFSDLLEKIIDLLSKGHPLDARLRDHPLKGPRLH